jgi:hypothetical protein
MKKGQPFSLFQYLRSHITLYCWLKTDKKQFVSVLFAIVKIQLKPYSNRAKFGHFVYRCWNNSERNVVNTSYSWPSGHVRQLCLWESVFVPFQKRVLKRLINYETIIWMLSNNTFVKEQGCFLCCKVLYFVNFNMKALLWRWP